jgi:hypothetical protein
LLKIFYAEDKEKLQKPRQEKELKQKAIKAFP